MSIKSFFESAQNRAGMAALAGTALTVAVQAFTGHTLPPLSDLLGLAIGAGLIVVPDNTVTVAQLEKAIADTKAALTTKSPAAIETVVEDAAGIVASVAKASVPTADIPPTTVKE